METNEVVTSTPNYKGWLIALAAGLVIALGGFAYSLTRSNELSEQIAANQTGAMTQISKLSEENALLRAQQQQKLEEIATQLKGVNDSAAAAVRRARVEVQKQQEELNQKLTATHEAVNGVSGEVSKLRDNTDKQITQVSTNVTEVKSNVETVKTNVEAVRAEVVNAQSEIAKNGAELKRAFGDMGVMSGLIATNAGELKQLRDLGERNYVEFDIAKKDGVKKVGDVTMTLRKSDMKRNRFTMDLVADDKKVQKKDKTINEPVQFYVSGNMHPYEIVVNQVSKDRVVGYLSTPKVKAPRLSASR
jgi:chromosome segregation ATPase